MASAYPGLCIFSSLAIPEYALSKRGRTGYVVSKGSSGKPSTKRKVLDIFEEGCLQYNPINGNFLMV